MLFLFPASLPAQLEDAGPNQESAGRQSVIEEINAFLEEKMKAIIMQHPEFMNTVNEFNALTKYYEDQRKTVFGKEERIPGSNFFY